MIPNKVLFGWLPNTAYTRTKKRLCDRVRKDLRKFNNDRRIGFLSVRRKQCGGVGLKEVTKKRLVEDEARRTVRRNVARPAVDTTGPLVYRHMSDMSGIIQEEIGHCMSYIFVHSFSRKGTHTP